MKKPQKTPQSGCPDSNQGLAAYKAVALPSALHPVNGPLHPLAVIFFCLALHYLILGFSNPRYRTNRVTFPLPECKKPPAGCSCRWPITNPGGMTLCTVLRPYTFVIIIITQQKRTKRTSLIIFYETFKCHPASICCMLFSHFMSNRNPTQRIIQTPVSAYPPYAAVRNALYVLLCLHNLLIQPCNLTLKHIAVYALVPQPLFILRHRESGNPLRAKRLLPFLSTCHGV